VCRGNGFAEEINIMTNEDFMSFPVPDVSDLDRPFWDGVQQGKLLLQKCLDCNRLQFFPRPVCVHCYSSNLDWQESCGLGEVYTFSLVYASPHPAVQKHIESTGLPAIFSIIELREGLRIISEVIGCSPEEIKLGSQVKLVCEEAQGTEFKLPKFSLIR
jgi:uncharacterized OB-fold protein